MRVMRRLVAVPLLLVAAPALAQKPWELRVDLPLTVPVELPAIAPTNPFAAPVTSVAASLATPMLAKLDSTFHVEAAVYVDAAGTCRRAVPLVVPLPGLVNDTSGAVAETTFVPAHARGQAVAVWLTAAFDLAGRIKEGRVTRLVPSAPDPASPPTPETASPPATDARDQALPATPAEQLDALPSVKRFRVSVPGRTMRQGFRLLAEVTLEGRCSRVVFLSCPTGLRPWLLRSLAGWTFRPATAGGEPVMAWVQLDGELEVELSGLSSDRLKVSRSGEYPRAAAAPAAAPPRGE
jgi:hypothetical protein